MAAKLGKPPTTPPHGYRSSVAYDPATKTWITVGPNGTDISTDDGRNWRPSTPTPPSTNRPTPTATGTPSRPLRRRPKGRIGKLDPGAFKHGDLKMLFTSLETCHPAVHGAPQAYSSGSPKSDSCCLGQNLGSGKRRIRFSYTARILSAPSKPLPQRRAHPDQAQRLGWEARMSTQFENRKMSNEYWQLNTTSLARCANALLPRQNISLPPVLRRAIDLLPERHKIIDRRNR